MSLAIPLQIHGSVGGGFKAQLRQLVDPLWLLESQRIARSHDDALILVLLLAVDSSCLTETELVHQHGEPADKSGQVVAFGTQKLLRQRPCAAPLTNARVS